MSVGETSEHLSKVKGPSVTQCHSSHFTTCQTTSYHGDKHYDKQALQDSFAIAR